MIPRAPVEPRIEEVLASPGPSRKPGRVGRFWRLYGMSTLFSVALLVLWEASIHVFDVKEYLFPAPSQVAVALKDDWSTILAPAMWTTLTEVALGFLIAAGAGIGLAILLHLFGPLRRTIYPLLIGSQTIPIVVLAPILVILLGFGIFPKLVIVALICFFPIVVNGIDGLRSVDDDLIHMMKTLDASRWAIFKRIEFPAALPAIFSGLRIAATFASIGAVFAEYAGSDRGLGYVIIQATANLQTARIFADIFILILISFTLFALVSMLERILVPWAPRGNAM